MLLPIVPIAAMKQMPKYACNRVVTMMMEVLTDVHLSIISQLKPDTQSTNVVPHQHEKIIDAIERRDEKMAFKNMKAHLTWTYEMTSKNREEEGQEFYG